MGEPATFRREDIAATTPIRLDIAARLAFPDGSIGISSLRREAARGRLRVWRIAGKDMTTLSEIEKMVELCLVPHSPPVSGSALQPATEKRLGSSSTADASIALAAAKLRVQKLSGGSPSTSPRSTTPRQLADVIPLK